MAATRRRQGPTQALVLLAGLAVMAAGARGAELRVEVVGVSGAQGAPLADAVASLHPVSGRPPAPAPAPPAAEMDQRNATFVPAVLAVRAGTSVTFPNSDDTLHHVYSFSPAKRFELPLYSGKRAPPVAFDTPGVVTLGCNIHDWMVAHVVVLDTPWHGRSGEDGSIRLQAPAGEYRLRVWHARAAAPVERRVAVGTGDPLVVRVPMAPPAPAATAPGSPRLRALQQQLRTPPAADGDTRR